MARISVGIALVCLLAMPRATNAQDTPLMDAVRKVTVETFGQPHHPPTGCPDVSMWDVSFSLASAAGAAIANAITALCTSDGSCREVMPVMRHWLGDGIVKAIVLKAGANAAIHYVVFRFMPRGKMRTATLAVVAGINWFDAIHDLRIMNDINRARGR